MEVFGGGAAACLSEVGKAQGLEIPDAHILFLCFQLAHVHIHPRILQTVTRHLVISKEKRARQTLPREGEDVKGKV